MLIHSALALALLSQAIPPELGNHITPNTLETHFPDSTIRVESCAIFRNEFADCSLEIGNMQVSVFDGTISSITINYRSPGYTFPGIHTMQLSELENAFLCSETHPSPVHDDEALARIERTLSCPALNVIGYSTDADPPPFCTLTFDSDGLLTIATCSYQLN